MQLKRLAWTADGGSGIYRTSQGQFLEFDGKLDGGLISVI